MSRWNEKEKRVRRIGKKARVSVMGPVEEMDLELLGGVSRQGVALQLPSLAT